MLNSPMLNMIIAIRVSVASGVAFVKASAWSKIVTIALIPDFPVFYSPYIPPP